MTEVDSKLIIHILIKLQWSSPPSKLSSHWRLESLINILTSLLPSISGLVPSHVKRVANKVADLMANANYDDPLVVEDSTWEEFPPSSLKQTCLALNQTNLPSPDGVSACLTRNVANVAHPPHSPRTSRASPTVHTFPSVPSCVTQSYTTQLETAPSRASRTLSYDRKECFPAGIGGQCCSHDGEDKVSVPKQGIGYQSNQGNE